MTHKPAHACTCAEVSTRRTLRHNLCVNQTHQDQETLAVANAGSQLQAIYASGNTRWRIFISCHVSTSQACIRCTRENNDTWTWTRSDTIHGKRTIAKDRPHSKARTFSSWQTYLTKSQDAKATGPEQRTLGSASPKVRYTETVTPTIRPRLWRHSSGIFLAIVGWFLLI